MKEIILKTTKGQRAQLQPMLDKIKEMALANERGILLAQVHATKIAVRVISHTEAKKISGKIKGLEF